ncbi:MAG: CrcB family protein [Actinobacteria bacterium]|nr:CrcB family protein [Actinomycetota bacterium]
MPRAEPSRGDAFVVVALGGAIGTLARWAVEIGIDAMAVPLAWATLIVNIAGCLLMGVLVSYVLAHPARHGLWRPFLGVGVLGGFTTFSAFAVDLVVLAREGHYAISLGYLVASVGGSLLAAWAGITAGQALRRGSAP